MRLRIDRPHTLNGPHSQRLDIAGMIEDGLIEITDAVQILLTPDEIATAIRSFFAGSWGSCSREDRESHALREGFDLLACFDQAGIRLHFLSDSERTMTRIVMASEV